MNPNREREEGRLSELDKEKLKKKISGPVVDRIDMWIEVAHVEHETLKIRAEREPRNESESTRTEVIRARRIQTDRFQSVTKTNADMNVRDIELLAELTDAAEQLLMRSAQTLRMSPRSYHRTIKLARTIADLEDSRSIVERHILEALTYRPRDLFD